MRSKTLILSLIIGALLLPAAWYAGRHTALSRKETILHTDTLTLIRRDTIIIRDTVPQKIHITRTDTLRMTTTRHDTVFVEVPISMYEFTDGENYNAKISGFRVKLEEMTLFPRTTEQIIEKTVHDRPKPKRWGVGIHAGYGVTGQGLSPYIGVGLSYNLFLF